jgi:cyanophycinase
MPQPQGRPGPIVIIGGAEDKLGPRTILSRFVTLAGGSSARIVVVSTASALGDQATDVYRVLFTQLGAADVRGLRPVTRDQCEDDEVVAAMDGATAVFMTGGNQVRLASVVGGTRLGREIIDLHEAGGVVGGTSAGASALSTHMVAFGASGDVPKQRMVQLSAGLGLVTGVIIDQHFGQRNRIGRLLSLVAFSPSQLGLGLDEDTAAVITEGRVLEVLGRGSVLIVDGSDVESNAFEAKRSQPLMVSGAVLHALPQGHRFDLVERRLLPRLVAATPSRRRGLVRSEAQLAWPTDMELDPRMVRRMAAEGADDTVVQRNARRRAQRREQEGEAG